MKAGGLTRREALTVGSRILVGAAIACRSPLRGPESPSIPRFQRAFHTPPVLRPQRSDEAAEYYEIGHKAGTIGILPGARTPIFGFEGMQPGPTIHARRDRAVIVRHANRLSTPTAVHLHGGAVPADSDGFPTDVIVPGESRTYTYPNAQPAATLWYHDHAIHQTGRNVYMGLAGVYIIHDEEEEGLGLPKGSFDVPLLLQQRSLRSDGSLLFDRERNLGAFGDIVLVNGVPWPRMEVCARRYRFRIVNAANANLYELVLSSGDPLVQIATDVGLLPSPVELERIPLAMGERAEVVIDFSKYVVGTRVILRNAAADGPQAEVMCFDVVCAEPDDSAVPTRMSNVDRLLPARAARLREFIFQGGPSSFPPHVRWTINGQGFDENRAMAHPRLDDVEIWRFVNRRRFRLLGMVHPVHVHLVRFLILQRNGGSPRPHEAGWKDTVAVSPGEDVRIIARFAGHRGRYLIHCHNLEHEDHDMMVRYDVV